MMSLETEMMNLHQARSAPLPGTWPTLYRRQCKKQPKTTTRRPTYTASTRGGVRLHHTTSYYQERVFGARRTSYTSPILVYPKHPDLPLNDLLLMPGTCSNRTRSRALPASFRRKMTSRTSLLAEMEPRLVTDSPGSVTSAILELWLGCTATSAAIRSARHVPARYLEALPKRIVLSPRRATVVWKSKRPCPQPGTRLRHHTIAPSSRRVGRW